MAASARSNFVDHRYVSRAPDGDGLNAPITALFLSLSLSLSLSSRLFLTQPFQGSREFVVVYAN